MTISQPVSYTHLQKTHKALIPVSYTHLDVYKRQLRKGAEYYGHTFDRISLKLKENKRRTFLYNNNQFISKAPKNMKILENYKI